MTIVSQVTGGDPYLRARPNVHLQLSRVTGCNTNPSPGEILAVPGCPLAAGPFGVTKEFEDPVLVREFFVLYHTFYNEV